MISLRVVFFVTLAVSALAYVKAYPPWSSPMTFIYKYMDVLSLDINLKNVPRRATSYNLFVKTENCDKNLTEKFKQPGSHCYEPVKHGYMQTYKPIHITQKLNKRSIRLDIAILLNTNKLCSTKSIIEGVRDENADKVENEFRRACLNNYDSPCTITVDLEDKCEDKIDCAQSNERLKCKSPDEDLPEGTVHQWSQRYRDGSSIGSIPPVKGKKSTFIIIFFYQFDDSTYIYNEMAHRKKEMFTDGFRITANEYYKKYEITKTETYSELEHFNFTCPNLAHTQIGWIDPTGYRITTYNVTSYSWSLIKRYNNSMLCCLHYTTYDGNVQRSVDSFTALKYKEPVEQDNVKDRTWPERNNSQDTQVTSSSTPQAPKQTDITKTEITSSTSSSTTPQTPKKTTSSLEPKAPQNSTPVKKPQEHPQSNLGQTQDPTSDNTIYYIGIVSVAGIIILISIIYVVVKKCCGKSSDPEQTLQLETYASSNMVLYAELDIRPGNAPPTANTEDPTYAEIIGVLKPQNENEKQ